MFLLDNMMSRILSLCGSERLHGAVLLFAVLAGLGLRVLFFHTSVTHLQPSSDESISMLQAQDVRAGRFPLLFMAQPYLFPIESYLAAPIVKWLPPTAWSARLVPTLLQAAAVVGCLLILRRMVQGPAFLIGAILTLVPSSYLLLMQAAYRPPAYSALVLLFAATLWFAERSRHSSHPWPLVVTGLLGGLAFSGHMLSICFVGPALLYACAGAWKRGAAWRLLWACTGLLLGLLPHLATLVFMPGSHAVVAQPATFPDFWRRLWDPALTYTWTVATGLRLANFIDEDVDPVARTGFEHACALLFALFVATLVARRLFHLARIARREHRLGLEMIDVLLMTVVANILLVAGNLRAHSGSVRYMTLTAFSLPLLLAWVAAQHRVARAATLAVTGLLLCVNLAHARILLHRWQQPDFPPSVGVADLNPALACLRDKGIQHVLASYGAAYRITYQSGRSILAAQRYNERFRGWPIPFQDEVQRADRVAYVLTDTISHLKPDKFERHLQIMQVAALVQTAGDFRIYSDFAFYGSEHALSSRQIRATASTADATAPRMLDRDRRTGWITEHRQRGGEWVALEWTQSVALDRVVLDLSHGIHDCPRTVAVDLQVDGQWTNVMAGLPVTEDKFQLIHGQPRYLSTTFTVRLAGHRATGLRLRDQEPDPEHAWAISEIEVFTADDAVPQTHMADSKTSLPARQHN
jgi:hypothetical protein